MSNSGPTASSPTIGRRKAAVWSAVVLVLAGVVFAHDLSAEPSFMDEWAYLSQTYYADLWLAGANDHPAWLDYAAYDLPPLPKYLFGISLRAAGYPRPGRDDMLRWYANAKSRCGPHAMLVAARWPTVVVGSLGCVAVFGLGTLACSRTTGVLAAILLMFNPLYRLHARRAMSDVIAEGLILLALWAGLLAWQRLLAGREPAASWLAAIAAGIAGGLAALAKLNGALALIVICAWVVLAAVLPRIAWRRKAAVLGAAVVAGVASLATFAAMNPVLTAHPRGPLPAGAAEFATMSVGERMVALARFRMSVSSGQKIRHAPDALHTLTEKLATVAVQGFGRFGPFGPHESMSWIRYDVNQDWGAPIWIAVVIAGVGVLASQGRRQQVAGAPPTAWAVLVYALVALVAVTLYVPMAWDRYYLSIQPAAAILGAAALARAGTALHQRYFRRGERA